MKKILFVLPDLEFGGAQRNTINIVNKLCLKYKCKIILIYNSKINLEINKKIEVKSLNVSKLRFGIYKLYREIKIFSPDIIYSTIGYINLVLILLNILICKKIKVIIREANFLSINIKRSKFKLMIRIAYQYIYPISDNIICSSKAMKDDMVNILGKKILNKITLINNFVDVELIDQNIKKKKFKIDRNYILIISSGRLTNQKGFDKVIKNFSKYKYSEIKLIIFGKGEEEKILKKTINKYGLKNIIIKQPTKNIWLWIYYSDYFMFTSRWEGMPNILLEALHCGTKILDFSNIKQIDEIYDEKYNKNIIRMKLEEKININTLSKKNYGNSKSILPTKFYIDENIQSLENLIEKK